MFLILPDIWTHILIHLEYSDLYSFRCTSPKVLKLYQKPLIQSLIQFKYTQYRHQIKELMIKFMNETVHADRGTIYFEVKDVNFKLYRKHASTTFEHLQDYSSDLHFYCHDPSFYEDADDQEPRRSMLTAHQSPFNTDPVQNDEIYVQIDPSIAQHLTDFEGRNKDHLYVARKYPVPEESKWSDSDDDFRDDLGPLDDFWPLDEHETKTVDSTETSAEYFIQLLSDTYKNVDQYWIISFDDLDQIIRERYSELLRYIIYNEMLHAQYFIKMKIGRK